MSGNWSHVVTVVTRDLKMLKKILDSTGYVNKMTPSQMVENISLLKTSLEANKRGPYRNLPYNRYLQKLAQLKLKLMGQAFDELFVKASTK